MKRTTTTLKTAHYVHPLHSPYNLPVYYRTTLYTHRHMRVFLSSVTRDPALKIAIAPTRFFYTRFPHNDDPLINNARARVVRDEPELLSSGNYAFLCVAVIEQEVIKCGNIEKIVNAVKVNFFYIYELKLIYSD